MQVLYEKRQGSNSSFHPYLQELPPHFDMPLQWSKEELDELQYPCMNVMVCTSLSLGPVKVLAGNVDQLYEYCLLRCPAGQAALAWHTHTCTAEDRMHVMPRILLLDLCPHTVSSCLKEAHSHLLCAGGCATRCVRCHA